MKDRIAAISVSLVFILLASFAGGCRVAIFDDSPPGVGDQLIIFHAGSLTIPVQELSEQFEEQHPHITVRAEAAGSRTSARKVSELGRRADLVLSADYAVIEALLMPSFANWQVLFARNAMVIAHTERSLYAEEIDGQNWHQILLREGVIFGHSDPDSDPNGYRTLMVWQLAERYYAAADLFEKLDQASPPEVVRPKSTDLIALLESGDMDYAFSYLSVAKQHGLPYVDLPPEINLGSVDHADRYRQVEVRISGREPGESLTRRGEPIVYGATIPKNSRDPALALEFMQFLLGPTGQAILREHGQPPLQPPLTQNYDLLPAGLKERVEPWRP